MPMLPIQCLLRTRSCGALPLDGFLPLFLTMVLLGAGCSRVAVHSMADPEADFTAYATFKILPRGGQPHRPAEGSAGL